MVGRISGAAFNVLQQTGFLQLWHTRDAPAPLDSAHDRRSPTKDNENGMKASGRVMKAAGEGTKPSLTVRDLLKWESGR